MIRAAQFYAALFALVKNDLQAVDISVKLRVVQTAVELCISLVEFFVNGRQVRALRAGSLSRFRGRCLAAGVHAVSGESYDSYGYEYCQQYDVRETFLAGNIVATHD